MIGVLNTEVERNSKIKTNLVYVIYLVTTNLFVSHARQSLPHSSGDSRV